MNFNKITTSKFKIPTKVKIYIICGIATFFAFIVALVILVSLIMAPIQMIQSASAETGNAQEETIYNTIRKTAEYYQKERKVTIDTALVASIVFYNQLYNPDGDYIICDLDTDSSCDENDENQIDYKKYQNDAKYIMENMMKEETKYYCKIIESYDQNSRPQYGKTVSCGASTSDCSVSKCTELYEVLPSTSWVSKSKEEFNAWLMDNYIEDKLKDVDPNFVNLTEERKKERMESAIEEMYNQRDGFYYLVQSKGSDGPGLLAADATGYRIRAGMPTELGEGAEFYFTSKNRLYSKFLGQCTWYAFGRANEILANAGSDLKWNYAGNANEWYNYNLSLGTNGFKSSRDVPKVGAIIVWGNGTFGHVAIVEKVYDDGKVDYSEANATGCFIDLHDMYGVWPSNEQLFACNEQREPGNTYGFRYRKHIDPHTTPDLQGYIYIVE